MHIQEIMGKPHKEVNEEHSFLVGLPTVGRFVGLSFLPFNSTLDEVQCFPSVDFVQYNGAAYSKIPFSMMEGEYEALAVYAEMGKLKRQALLQEIEWEELLEACNTVFGEVTKPCSK